MNGNWNLPFLKAVLDMLLHPCNKNIKKWMKYISHNQILPNLVTPMQPTQFFFSYMYFMSMYERKKERCNIGQFEKCFLSPKDKQIFFQAWYQNITKMVAFVGGSHPVVSRTFFSKKHPHFKTPIQPCPCHRCFSGK